MIFGLVFYNDWVFFERHFLSFLCAIALYGLCVDSNYFSLRFLTLLKDLFHRFNASPVVTASAFLLAMLRLIFHKFEDQHTMLLFDISKDKSPFLGS